MPIKLDSFEVSPICHGHEWVIKDEQKLARMVAQIILGQFRHVEKILNDIPGTPTRASCGAIDRAKTILTNVTNDKIRFQRDGWVFQIISWIAANLEYGDSLKGIPPHNQPADKGFDSLFIGTKNLDGGLSKVVIGEDKATEYPRNKIQSQIWTDFKECEDGYKDSALLSEVTTLVERIGIEDPDKILSEILWENVRHYRISITIDESFNDREKYRSLFKDYDSLVDGVIERRSGNVIKINDLRAWMDSFCENVINELEGFSDNV